MELLLPVPDQRGRRPGCGPGRNVAEGPVKRSLAPKPERGFREACADLDASKRLIVYPSEECVSVGTAHKEQIFLLRQHSL